MKKMIPAIAMTACFLTGSTLAATTLTNDTDKLSYSMGYKTGQAMKARNVQVNPNTFAAGLNAGYQGEKPAMTEAQMQSTLAAAQKQMIQKMQQKMKEAANKNQKEGQEFLTKNASEPGVVTTKSGLQYKILTKGQGTPPSTTDTVTVNYEGKLINGSVFDSSYQRKKPVSFKVNQVIKGWQEALTKMKPGATWMLYIPSKLAYGSQGSFGKIGPNETLIFKVNLISVKK